MKEVISIPNASKTFKALRSLGYDINSSIADIIDNAITEKVGADNVSVLFNLNKDYEITARIIDNGTGMTSDQLREAMRIGADSAYEAGSLGKFGMGMKTASLAHCNILTVISKTKETEVSGFSWNLGHVKKIGNWSLLELDETEIDKKINDSNLQIGDQGTIVFWDDLFLMNSEFNSNISNKLASNYLFRKIESLKLHLRMVFHRFLDSNDNTVRNITLRVNNDDILKPWDPFCRGEPETVQINLSTDDSNLFIKSYQEPIIINAYILPNKEYFSSENAWREAKGLLSWNDAQGYYIYRANRLIRFGGWHGTKAKDEHDKLARLSIDIDPILDDEFRITVNKNKVEFPELLFQHLKNIVNPIIVKKAKARYKREPERNKVENKVRNNKRIQQVSESLLTYSKITTKSNDSKSGYIEVNNQFGTWLSNKLNEFLKYGNEEDFEIVSDHIDNGHLWKIICDPNNKFKVIVNSSHPFYSMMYKKGIDKKVTEAIDVLIFSLAFSELYNKNQENAILFETYKSVFSKSLEKLIKEKIL